MQALRYFPSRKAVRGMTHQQPENVQARFLSQSSKRIDGLRCFHISGTMEILALICDGVNSRTGVDVSATGNRRNGYGRYGQVSGRSMSRLNIIGTGGGSSFPAGVLAAGFNAAIPARARVSVARRASILA